MDVMNMLFMLYLHTLIHFTSMNLSLPKSGPSAVVTEILEVHFYCPLFTKSNGKLENHQERVVMVSVFYDVLKGSLYFAHVVYFAKSVS